MNRKVLLVDDERLVLHSLRRQLAGSFEVETAGDGEAGLEMIRQSGPFAAVVADMRMPKMDGVAFLRRVLQIAPSTTRIMLTGNVDQKTAASAVNEGRVFRFVTKPCDSESLCSVLESAVEQYRLVTAEAELLGKTLTGAIGVLGELLAITDPDTFNRARRIKQYARDVASAVGCERAYELEIAAILMHLGYVSLPRDLVKRRYSGAELTEPERRILDRVPGISASLIAKIPRLEGIAEIVLHSYTPYNGAGLPAGAVRGDNLPIGARTLKILRDLVDLELSGVPQGAALKRLMAREGWYDPTILEGIAKRIAPGTDLRVVESQVEAPIQTQQSATEALKALAAQYQDAVPSQKLPISDVSVGDVVLTDVKSSDGTVLVRAGSTITEIMLHFLKNCAEHDEVIGPVDIAKAA
jgi:response regulator RpfG family c-di-GMP phosphodiesterase